MASMAARTSPVITKQKNIISTCVIHTNKSRVAGAGAARSRPFWLEPQPFLYHQIRLSISFPTPYSKLFYCKNSRSYGEKKTESRKRWLGFSSFFGFVQTYFAISRAVGVRFLNVFISLDSSFHKLSNAVFQIVLLQKLAKLRRKQAPAPGCCCLAQGYSGGKVATS